MKPETLNTLIAARVLFDAAREHCAVDDKYIASAGLVMLQDGLELVLYACLLELDEDKSVALDALSFDQLLGQLKKAGKPVQKSGTLKALNKQRVLIKHFGQIAEPSTVRTYYEAAHASADHLLQQVVRKNMQEILLADVIKNDAIRAHIATANAAIEKKSYFDALVEVRKALYLAVEVEYSVFDWKDHPRGKEAGVLEMLGKGGAKAPWHTKNKEWIDLNVRDPFDYIQLDHEKLRIDLLEWGVSTQDFWNLWRLTPQVFLVKESKAWKVSVDPRHVRGGATEANARYCLDRVVSLLAKKQSHLDLSRQLEFDPKYNFQVRLKSAQPLYSKAAVESPVRGELQQGKLYQADAAVAGLSDGQYFIRIAHLQTEEPRWLVGYVIQSECEVVQ